MNELLEIELKEKELAPRAGFNGDGLDQNRNNDNNNNFGKGRKNVVDYVGEKDRKGRDDDDIEEEGKDEDHEKNAGLQDEEN